MHRLKLVGVLLGALCAVGMMATSAFALPDISIALGGAYPIHLEGNLPTASTSLGTAGGSLLTGKGVSILTLTNELSALGPFSSTFLNVIRAGTETSCKSVGDAAGVVLTNGAFHIVLGTGGTASTLFSLFLVNTFIITCGALEVEVRGSVMSTFSLASGNEADDYTTALGLIEGEKGKQKFKEYTNDAGETTVLAKLESEAGTGFVESDENVVGGITLTALEGKMFTVTGR